MTPSKRSCSTEESTIDGAVMVSGSRTWARPENGQNGSKHVNGGGNGLGVNLKRQQRERYSEIDELLKGKKETRVTPELSLADPGSPDVDVPVTTSATSTASGRNGRHDPKQVQTNGHLHNEKRTTEPNVYAAAEALVVSSQKRREDGVNQPAVATKSDTHENSQSNVSPLQQSDTSNGQILHTEHTLPVSIIPAIVDALPQIQSTYSCHPKIPSTVEIPNFGRLTTPSTATNQKTAILTVNHPHQPLHTDLNGQTHQISLQPQTSLITTATASATTTASSSQSSKSKNPSTLRRGKWTVEEEAYVARVIQDFNSGYLNTPAGTTLRSYLSEKLHCDPMRITKKFTGDACIGKRVFHPAVRCPSNTAAIDKAQTELDALERRWRRRLEMQQRESAKKAAASAAAAAAAAVSNRGGLATTLLAPSPNNNQDHQMKQTVTRTASWLDRANAILSGPQPASPLRPLTVPGMPPKVIENQMKEVQRLIHEGPIIQQTTAGLPQLIDHKHSPQYEESDQHLDKRPRRESGAEDAEALVGFVNSVRASAAAAQAAGRLALD